MLHNMILDYDQYYDIDWERINPDEDEPSDNEYVDDLLIEQEMDDVMDNTHEIGIDTQDNIEHKSFLIQSPSNALSDNLIPRSDTQDNIKDKSFLVKRSDKLPHIENESILMKILRLLGILYLIAKISTFINRNKKDIEKPYNDLPPSNQIVV